MFPAVNPLEIRQTKAREVFLLFNRAEKMNRALNEEKSNNTTKKTEDTDVTGQYTDWW